mmetsp:Transcript_32135/g.53096  ORF Transcript_32135/g.53096 Transcript_32135/m.53096 type:complete len:163 (-) Transcript_32135:1280-1768(-)
MAFDHPLEADKVDDSGLFSTFVTVPAVGFIMWVLGADEAKKKEEEQQKRELKEQLEGEHNSSSSGGEHESSSSEKKTIPSKQLHQMITYTQNKRMRKKMPPRMVGSDLSDFGDLAIAMEESKFADSDSEYDIRAYGLRRSKKMSWSDESGKDLCEIKNEVSQ